ncbi:MAG TPA: xylulokinase [Anaerolineaceae bacterium]|nr:xylulokinase [Anaerolineaceae bacterium]
MNYLLGFDLGTTSLKGSLFKESGEVVCTQTCNYPILVPYVGFAEQDPQVWWEGFINVCRSMKKQFPAEMDQVAGIGLCGQMHTQVYLDAQDRIIRPAITWMDQRSSQIADRIKKDDFACDLLMRETGNFATTTYTALHMKWVQENQPEIWSRTAHVLVAKDYLKYKLTGRMVTDYAEASGTLLFNVQKEVWSSDVFDYFAIPKDYFPEVMPSDSMIGTVSKEASQLTGLKVGIPVVNGSSDNSASALGAGMTEAGQVTLILGTAGVISVCSDQPLVDPKDRTMCWHYCLPNKWITLGIMQTAGESLEWFKNTFDPSDQLLLADDDIFKKYNEIAETIPEGCEGLTFLPYLNGERTPYWDADARGVFFGINLKSSKAHFIRAVMEGVSFAFRNNIETVESLGIKINEVRAVGGGLKSKLWLEILGKVLQKPIATVSVADTANLGNILLCGRALGLYSSYKDTVDKIVTTDQHVFFPGGSEQYGKQYHLFLDLYEKIRPLYKNI